MLFWKRKQQRKIEARAEDKSYLEILEFKHQTHEAVERANCEIEKMNARLVQNHLTIQIRHAVGGKDGH